MRIVVNHVTRMSSDSRICVAGIDAATFQHVRPVTPASDLITRTLLRENGGPFGSGALVDLGPVGGCPNPPETEDHEFATVRAKRIEDLSDEAYLELLEQVSDRDVPSAFGPDLVEVRPRKLAVPAGRGSRSLAVLPVINPELRVKFGKLYLKLDPPNTPTDTARSARQSPLAISQCTEPPSYNLRCGVDQMTCEGHAGHEARGCARRVRRRRAARGELGPCPGLIVQVAVRATPLFIDETPGGTAPAATHRRMRRVISRKRSC
jgi:hypothetical protein